MSTWPGPKPAPARYVGLALLLPTPSDRCCVRACGVVEPGFGGVLSDAGYPPNAIGKSAEGCRSHTKSDRDSTSVKALVPHSDCEIRRAKRERAGEMDGISTAELMGRRQRTRVLLDGC